MYHPLTLLTLAGAVTAHYQLQWPQPSGDFNDELEGQSPCGGVTPSVSSSSTKIDINQFSIAIRNSHPTGNFRFYATLDTTGLTNFTEITPGIKSTNPGAFCSTGVYAPSSFAGKQGVLQVVENGGHGSLYQCAPVNFVTSGGDSPGNACTNGSTTSIVWGASGSTSSHNDHANTTSTTTSSSASVASVATSSTRTGAAPTMTMDGVIAAIGMAAAGLLI